MSVKIEFDKNAFKQTVKQQAAHCVNSVLKYIIYCWRNKSTVRRGILWRRTQKRKRLCSSWEL